MKREVKQRPFAAFDIDGTLIRWQLYHAISDQLALAGRIDATSFEAVREARLTWKKRTSHDSFRNYERALIQTYDKAITNISERELMSAVKAVFKEYRDQTYIYTRDLVLKLKEEGYLLFAISGSQAEIVELLANYYGFDDYGGSTYERKGGYFTGQKNILKSERKPAYIRELVSKHNATFAGSIALGDSEGDVAMLEIVDQPIAFNPNELLFDHARKQGWKIVVERKNMVYELEKSSGSYKLKG